MRSRIGLYRFNRFSLVTVKFKKKVKNSKVGRKVGKKLRRERKSNSRKKSIGKSQLEKVRTSSSKEKQRGKQPNHLHYLRVPSFLAGIVYPHSYSTLSDALVYSGPSQAGGSSGCTARRACCSSLRVHLEEQRNLFRTVDIFRV